MVDYKKELSEFLYNEDPLVLKSPHKSEYDCEAIEILKLLEHTRNSTKIPLILANVFEKSFSAVFTKNVNWRALARKLEEHPVLKDAIGRKL